MGARIHSTAIVEDNVTLGEGTSVWDNAHIRHGASLGEQCIVGGKAYVAYDVQIGNRVKINSMAYICNGVTIEDGVMISASVTFTNDRFPRAATSDLRQLRSSEPDDDTLATLVCQGATIGAGAVVGPGLTIGRFAMVGMGAVVTRSVPDFHLVVGNPARSVGCVCRCGQPLMKWANQAVVESDAERGAAIDAGRAVVCSACETAFEICNRAVHEIVRQRDERVAR